jgi:hypothetical protein
VAYVVAPRKSPSRLRLRGFSLLMLRQGWLAAELHASNLRALLAFGGPRKDQVTLEFREAAEDREHQLAMWGVLSAQGFYLSAAATISRFAMYWGLRPLAASARFTALIACCPASTITARPVAARSRCDMVGTVLIIFGCSGWLGLEPESNVAIASGSCILPLRDNVTKQIR